MYDVGKAYGHAGNIMGFSSNSVYLPGRGNRFAMTLIADETHADTAAKGSNKIATVLKHIRK